MGHNVHIDPDDHVTGLEDWRVGSELEIRDFDDNVAPIRRLGLATEREGDCGGERRHNQPNHHFFPDH